MIFVIIVWMQLADVLHATQMKLEKAFKQRESIKQEKEIVHLEKAVLGAVLQFILTIKLKVKVENLSQ